MSVHSMPDTVVDLIESHLPDHIKAAVRDLRQARTAFGLCRSEFTREAREYAISDMARADKVLATYPQAAVVLR
ncbi:hypothetical protein [Streptomyces sp. NPDC012888]|uniref:hypothetical protein n=1 Tax=Streptomyces sp. NPDC012888 TaxID=3364855 RepID=UPI0036A0B5F2